jgi:predicted small integral membrane protein
MSGTEGLSWMAWTWQTGAFFAAIAASLMLMSVWEWARPGGNPRVGALGLLTTRGDRLFISLLAGAYIHLGWLAFATGPLWWASVIAIAVAILVFAFV